jgi:hypothetical protein
LCLPSWEFWRFIDACIQEEAIKGIDSISIGAVASGRLSEEKAQQVVLSLQTRAGYKPKTKENWIGSLREAMGARG